MTNADEWEKRATDIFVQVREDSKGSKVGLYDDKVRQRAINTISQALASSFEQGRVQGLEEAVEAVDKFQEGEGAHGFLAIDCSKEELKKAIRNLGRKRDE